MVSGAAEAKDATTRMSSARAPLRNVDLNLEPIDEEDEFTVPPQGQSSAPATNVAAANLGLTAPATSSIAATTGPSITLSRCLATA